jgi:plasmid stability protein
MPSIQIKDVPEDVHATLRRRAAAAGQSLQEYLLARLSAEARTPTLDELFDRVEQRTGGRVGLKAAARAVRAERDAR